MTFLAVLISDGQVIAGLVAIAGGATAVYTALGITIKRLYIDLREDRKAYEAAIERYRAESLGRMQHAVEAMSGLTAAVNAMSAFIRTAGS